MVVDFLSVSISSSIQQQKVGHRIVIDRGEICRFEEGRYYNWNRPR